MRDKPSRTGRGLIASYCSNPDVSQIGNIQRPIWRHHQGGGTVKPGVFSVAVSGLVAVAVGIILRDGEEGAANKDGAEVRGGEQHQE